MSSWNLVKFGSSKGLLPLPEPVVTYCRLIFEIQKFYLKKIHLRMSAKCWPFCFGLHVLQFSVFYSMAPGRSGFNFKSAIFNLVLLIGIFRSYDNALRWMSWDLSEDKSALGQEMAWCHQVSQQAITWANVDPDLCRHMASLGHNLSSLSAGSFIAWYCYAQSIISNWLSSWCSQSLLNLFSSTWIVYLLKTKFLLNPSYRWLSVRLQ